MQRFRSSTAVSVAVLIGVLARSLGASAAAQQLDCVLTDTADQLGSESRPIGVVFDENAKTVQVQLGSQTYNLSNVSISNIAISGNVDNYSLGIDRSSMGIVWQQYGADKPVTEFGRCRRADHAAAAGTH